MIGYKLFRPSQGNTWMFCGTTPEQVAECVRVEIESDESPVKARTLHLEAFEVTQEEIDAMPDFPGW